MMFDNIPLLLFAKAPIAGSVKTRLMTHCSAEQAAEIAKRLMEESIQRACESWPGEVFLSVWLDLDHVFFSKMRQRYAITVTQQCEGDLGAKMRHALSSYGYPAAVMGCDAPHTLASSLRQAYTLLQSGKSVIGPSDDGGYYFLGLCHASDDLFLNKPWGQDQVFEKTLASANSAGLTLKQLPSLNDVDEWQDLLDASETITSLRTYLQAEGLYYAKRQ
ncbi:MAG: rSAM/selenodomain-associated transferase 1 [Arenicella sp.]|jgi:rSAM/selenodomain-associated transferase 1